MAQDNSLVDQKLALSMFLDALLHEAPEADPAMQAAEPPAAPLPVQEAPTVALLKPVLVPPTLQPEVLAPTPETTLPEPSVPEPVLPATQSATEPRVPAAEAGVQRPDWAVSPFQILLFKVAGLGLAVPLIELNGILEWTDEVTPMPGHADFYLGLLHHRERSVPVVDPARLVLPADRQAALAGDPRERVSRIVLIDEGRWGLACDEVSEVVTVRPDQVRWRSSRTRRRWLAGTVVDHMCALLDTRTFAQLLASGRE